MRGQKKKVMGRGSWVKKDKGLIFVISGPSGSGKTSLLAEILKAKELRSKLIRSVSLTTRKRRTGERNRKDYFFVTLQEFNRLLKAKKILERTRYLGYYYATPRDFVEKQIFKGKHIGLCLDLRGALKLKRLYPRNTITIFVEPPSLDALKHRITNRCSKTKPEEIGKRIKRARIELLHSRKYDYCLMNKNLESAAGKLKKIVLNEINNAARKR